MAYFLSAAFFLAGCHQPIKKEQVERIEHSLDSLNQKLTEYRSRIDQGTVGFADCRIFVKDSLGGQLLTQIRADSSKNYRWGQIQNGFQDWQISGRVIGGEWQLQLDEADSWLKRAKEDQVASIQAEKKWVETKEKIGQIIANAQTSLTDLEIIQNRSDSLILTLGPKNRVFFGHPGRIKPIISR